MNRPVAAVQSNAQTALEPAAYVESFVEVDGLRLHVQDYGASGKPPILCVHGGGANAHWYDFVAEGFNTDYHVRAVDLRGHGDSDWDNSNPPNYKYSRHAADLHALTEELDLRDFVLIGHSMGGTISAVYAATYPGRAKALIIVDSNLVMSPERIASFQAVADRPAREYATQEEFIANYRVRPGGTTAAPEAVRYIARHSGRRFDDDLWRHKVDRRTYANRELFDSFALWDRIKIPALLMKASCSPRMTLEAIAEIKSRATQVTMTLVPDADHHITLDNPAGFIRAAREFLADVHITRRQDHGTDQTYRDSNPG
jgi:pimeloyl-ACP methyl ester carboxylesterase